MAEGRSRRVGFRLPLGAVVIASLLLACGEDHRATAVQRGDALVRYDDFVTDGATAEDSGVRAQRICADETRFVRVLEPGETIRFPLELGREPTLALSACLEKRGGGELRVVVRSEAGDPIEASLALPQRPAWKRTEVDLSPLAGRPVELEVTAATTRGRLMLDEAWVRHLSGRPARWPAAPEEERGTGAETTPRREGGEENPPRVLLISVDTLRPDFLALDQDGETPNLARLAADGEVFTVHRPGASWTKPSHATLLTGYPESVHRADGGRALSPHLPRLPGRLRDGGVATGGIVVDCVWLNPKFGFDVGFDEYRYVKWDTAQLGRAAVNWMAAHRDDPFFFFLHTYEPHSDFHQLPYESEGTRPAHVRERFGVEDYGCREGECASTLLEKIGAGEIAPLPGEAEILRDLYRRGIADTDRKLGILFQDLRDLGLYDDLLIVMTSDHGELFLEHGGTLHGTYWEPVLQVPLIVKWPRSEDRAGRVTQIPTTALDVAPTILSTAGLDARDLPGSDLRRPRPDRPIFVGHPDWWVVYEGRHKGIFPRGERRMLFDLTADPGEKRNLRFEDRETYRRLESRLRDFRAWSDQARERLVPANGEQQSLTPEEEERLRALGYLQ